MSETLFLRGCTTRTEYFKCMEVKTGFYRNKSMQTGSSGTLIGWKSGQTTFVPLWDRMEGAWLRTLYGSISILSTPYKWSDNTSGKTRGGTGYFKYREVKTGFCRNRSRQTGSSGTLIGWESLKPLLSLYGTEWSVATDSEADRRYDMNGRFQMQGGKNWILPK
jgi:hypothetical protein